jgi:DNA polymerase III alpha subunit (gram-positive type)
MSTSKPTLYLSFDVEADGPSPVNNSMVQLGIVAVTADGREIFSLCWNIEPHPNCSPDETTMKEFWAKHPEEWKATQTNQLSGDLVRQSLAQMVTKWSKEWRLQWIAYPAAFDWQWVKDIYEHYNQPGDPDIGYSAKCISTLLWGYEKTHGIKTPEQKEALKKELAGELTLTHNAEEDARYQARIFVNLCKKMGIAL